MRISLILILGLFTTLKVFSQENDNYYFWPYNNYTEKIEFSESVHIPEANEDTLFNNAKAFVEKTFRSEKDTIFVEDATTKTIVCKGNFFVNATQLGDRGKGYISFKLSINCVENSYRYSLTNFEHSAMTKNGVFGGALENETAAIGGRLFPSRYWSQQKARCYYLVQTTIEQLKEAMSKNTNG